MSTRHELAALFHRLQYEVKELIAHQGALASTTSSRYEYARECLDDAWANYNFTVLEINRLLTGE